MVKLNVTLPAIQHALRSRDSNASQEQTKTISSTERVRRYREKLKNNPKYKQKLLEIKEKKKAKNKENWLKLKYMRQNNNTIDENYKQKQRKWQTDCRKRKCKALTKPKLQPHTPDKRYSVRKRVERLRESLPNDSGTWVKTMSHIIRTASPKRSSLLLSNTPAASSDNIAEALYINKAGRPLKNQRAAKKKLAFTEEANELWENRRSLSQYKRRQRKQAKSITKAKSFRATWKSELDTFLESHSRIMPNKKDTVIVEGKTVAKRHLLGTKLELYRKFKSLHPNFGRKFTVFKEMIPRNFKKLDLTCRRVCICTKDYNFDRQVEALNKVAQQSMLPCLKATPKILSDLTLCPYQDIPRRACIDRQCTLCGTSAVHIHYLPLLQACKGKTVKYYQWESKEDTYVTKQGDKKTHKRWIQVLKASSVDVLVDTVAETLNKHSSHLFRAMYQHKMQRMLVNQLPLDHCLVVMDFSENISLQPQDEIESAHWTTKQVTLHPIYIERHDSTSTIEHPVIMKESLVIISDCLNHNADTVYAFTTQLLTHLSKNPGPCPIKVIHRYTDNCATQYKSKYAFQHLHQIEQSFDVKVIYNYTESGHGKGPSDGIGAAVKRKLERLILGGQVVVNNAYQVYLALNQHKKEFLNQNIIYVPSRKIMNSLPNHEQSVKCLSGTQTFHMVHNLSTRNGNLCACYDLSCSCNVCISSAEGPCIFGQYRDCKTPVYYSLTTGKKISVKEAFPVVGSNNIETGATCDQLSSESVLLIECPVMNNEEFSTFQNKIAAKGWKIRGETPGDGNCFFWCVSDQLDYLGINQLTHTDLRKRVFQHMKNLPQSKKKELQPFLMSDNFKHYIDNMVKNGTYADHICLQNTSEMLSCNLKIVHAETTDINIATETGHPILVVGYLPGIQHYVSLEPILRYRVDDYVSVELTGSRSNKMIYIGQIIELDINTNEFKVCYMKKVSRQRDLYFWPDTKDESWESISSITSNLGEPIMSNRSTKRRVLFEFP